MAVQRFLTAEQGVEQLLKATPPLHFNGQPRRNGKRGEGNSGATSLAT